MPRRSAGRTAIDLLPPAACEVIDDLRPDELPFADHQRVGVAQGIRRHGGDVRSAQNDAPAAGAQLPGQPIRVRRRRGVTGDRNQICVAVQVDGLNDLVGVVQLHARRRVGCEQGHCELRKPDQSPFAQPP